MKITITSIRIISLLAAVSIIPFGIGMENHGSISYGSGSVWTDFFIWASLCGLLALSLNFLKVRHKPILLISAVILYLSAGVGWGQSTAVLYFVLSAYALGRLFLDASFKKEREKVFLAQSITIGIGCYVCLFGILIHFPVNYPEFYLGLLAIPLLAALSLNSIYKHGISMAWRNVSCQIASLSYMKLSFAVIVIGYVARYAFFPSVNYDDNAMHLRMWTVLANRHIYDFDIRSQVWSVAPFTVDLLHAIVSLISYTDARGALNLGLLAALLFSMWKLTRLVNHRLDDRLLVIVLFSTTPMLATLLTGLQTELLLAVLATTGTLFALQRQSVLSGPSAAAMIMISALCSGTKLPGAILGLALLGTFLLELLLTMRNKQVAADLQYNFRELFVVILIAGFVAFHSYVFAVYLTGNPFFPLYNGYFKSPFFGAYNFIDNRYVTGVSLKTYWDLFFNTGKHFESGNFVAGFQYLLLLPLSIITLLFFRGRRSATKILLPLLVFGVVMFSAVQYWRYLFPILPLGSVLIGALFFGVRRWTRYRLSHDVTAGVFIVFTAVNLFFLQNINWYFNIPSQKGYTESGRQLILMDLAPEQYLNAQMNRYAPNAKILYEASRPYGATLIESPTYVNWYAPAVQEKIKSIRTADEMAKFLQNEHINYVYWDLSIPFDMNDSYRALLSQHLNRFGVPELIAGSIVAYRLKEFPITYRKEVYINDFREYQQLTSANDAKIDDSGDFLTGSSPVVVRTFNTKMASSAKYSVRIECPVKGAGFVAQINWNQGTPYYRLVACNREFIDFSESMPIPVGATQGTVYLTSRDRVAVKVNEILIELN